MWRSDEAVTNIHDIMVKFTLPRQEKVCIFDDGRNRKFIRIGIFSGRNAGQPAPDVMIGWVNFVFLADWDSHAGRGHFDRQHQIRGGFGNRGYQNTETLGKARPRLEVCQPGDRCRSHHGGVA